VAVDSTVGLPITVPLLHTTREFVNDVGDRRGGFAIRLTQARLRRDTDYVEAIVLGGAGEGRARTLKEFAARVTSPRIVDAYGNGMIMVGMSLVVKIHQALIKDGAAG